MNQRIQTVRMHGDEGAQPTAIRTPDPDTRMKPILFSGLLPAAIDDILGLARKRHYSRGATVFHQGDPAVTLHVVSRGLLALRFTQEDGQSTTLRVFGPGDAFGRAGVSVDNPTRVGSCVALEDCDTYELTLELMAQSRVKYPALNNGMMMVLLSELSQAYARLLDLSNVPADVRVRRSLAALAARCTRQATGISVPITQDDLAGLASTSRSTVNRVLAQQETLRRVALRRGTIVVLDLEGLLQSITAPDP